MALRQTEIFKEAFILLLQNGLGNTIVKYACLEQDIQQFRACLKTGYPFTVGFEICSSFWKLENTINGLMLMPTEMKFDWKNLL